MSETKELTNELLKEKMTDAMVGRGLCANLDAKLPPGIYITNAATIGTFPPIIGAMARYAIVEYIPRYLSIFQRLTSEDGLSATRVLDANSVWGPWKEPIYH